jgi:hypothetical protein
MLSSCFASRKCERTSNRSQWEARSQKSSSPVGPATILTTSLGAFLRSFPSNVTQCEGGGSSNDSHGRRERPADDNPYKDEIERMQRELEEPCKACMYTGVAVCTGLSLYFVKLATEETTLPKNRRFLWVCSASSIAAGVYRWYIG